MTNTPSAGSDAVAIRLSGLHKSFGDVRAVRGIDLTVAPGEIVAFLGPNGAGKSTTIDMLLGLTTPDTGTVSLFGGDPHAAVVAGRVGAMLQAGALLPDEKVAGASRPTGTRATAAHIRALPDLRPPDRPGRERCRWAHHDRLGTGSGPAGSESESDISWDRVTCGPGRSSVCGPT